MSLKEKKGETMEKKRVITLSILLAFLFVGCYIWPVSAADKQAAPAEPMDSLVLAMSTDDVPIFDAAITIGTVALRRGHAVTMLLRVDAIKVAVAKNNYTVGNSTLPKKLSAFMASGARVIAGGACMKEMGLTQGDLITGVIVGTPDLVMGTLFKKDTKILSY